MGLALVVTEKGHAREGRTMLLDAVRRYGSLYLRLALAAGFLASVTDRLGLWGRPGTQNVSWGNLQRFMAYTAQLNPWAPPALIPAIAWFVTAAESALACALLLGLYTRWSGFLSGVLILLFGLGMTIALGVKSALDFSVFAASAAGFGLAALESYPWSIDSLRSSRPGLRPRTDSA
jgi:thiosulfate dehydrogenase (quinone) large subunit